MKKRFEIEPKLNDKQMLIAKNRYLMLDAKGQPKETVREMFIRVSKYIASIERKYKTPRKEIKQLEEDFYEMQANFEFIAGIPLNDRGRKKLMG
jgi:ribonucleotide reductase alpha subunit